MENESILVDDNSMGIEFNHCVNYFQEEIPYEMELAIISFESKIHMPKIFWFKNYDVKYTLTETFYEDTKVLCKDSIDGKFHILSDIFLKIKIPKCEFSEKIIIMKDSETHLHKCHHPCIENIDILTTKAANVYREYLEKTHKIKYYSPR